MKSKVSTKVVYDVPYYSQWESRELANSYIANPGSAIDDPLWRNSGASSKEEYVLWANNICGMACVKMLLEYFKKGTHRTIEIAKESIALGAYRVGKDTVDGLFYKGCVDFLRKRFEIKAAWSASLSLDNIIANLSLGNFVISSVSKFIRDPAPVVTEKGGHLVLVVGFDDEKRVLYVHNPSGYYPMAQAFFPVSYDMFARCFANRGIVVFGSFTNNA